LRAQQFRKPSRQIRSKCQGVALSGRFPYLRAGDVVEVDIEGLGGQRSAVRDAA